jgi:hypothetical protein
MIARHLGIGVALGLLLAACQDTLIYGESTAFNLAIHVNDSPQAPLEVNAGLKRYVAEKAPAVSTGSDEDGDDTAVGQAVSSFSGFALTYDREGIFGDLFIRTQFASGHAARALAGEPAEAAKVVHADFTGDPIFVSEAARSARGEIVDGIRSLDDAKASALACNPPVTNARLLEIAGQSDPGCVKRADPAFARQFLTELAFEDDRTPESFAKWRSALGLD